MRCCSVTLRVDTVMGSVLIPFISVSRSRQRILLPHFVPSQATTVYKSSSHSDGSRKAPTVILSRPPTTYQLAQSIASGIHPSILRQLLSLAFAGSSDSKNSILTHESVVPSVLASSSYCVTLTFPVTAAGWRHGPQRVLGRVMAGAKRGGVWQGKGIQAREG